MRAVDDKIVDMFVSAVTDHVTYIAIFEHGTTVYIYGEPMPTQALPFTREYVDEWPLGRLEDAADISEYIAESAENYAADATRWGSGIVYAAYTALIQGGYLGADSSATRAAIELGPLAWQVVYSATSDITNIVTHSDAAAAALLGGECRRFDWMFPKLRHVFSQA